MAMAMPASAAAVASGVYRAAPAPGAVFGNGLVPGLSQSLSDPGHGGHLGFSADFVRKGPGVQACELCAKVKTRCGGGNPCSRCARKGLVCTYGERKKRGRKNPPDGFGGFAELGQFAGWPMPAAMAPRPAHAPAPAPAPPHALQAAAKPAPPAAANPPPEAFSHEEQLWLDALVGGQVQAHPPHHGGSSVGGADTRALVSESPSPSESDSGASGSGSVSGGASASPSASPSEADASTM